jgi:hypothetical protein
MSFTSAAEQPELLGSPWTSAHLGATFVSDICRDQGDTVTGP